MNKRHLLFAILALFSVGSFITAYASEPTIKIGADFELSGSVGPFGQSNVDGIKLYIDQVNAGGGVLGQKIKLIAMDNYGTEQDIKRVTEKLIQKENVVAILGPVTSKDCFIAAPIAQNSQVPLLTGTATNIFVTKIGDYIFRACFIDSYQGKVMARFAMNDLKIKNAAIITDSKNTYCNDLAQAFKETFIREGGQIVAEDIFSIGSRDASSVIQRVMTKNPDMIFAPLYYQEAGVLAGQLRKQGIQIPVLGGDGWDSADLVKIADASTLNNLYFCEHYSVDNPSEMNQAFKNAYKKKYGKNPDIFAALGYDIAALVVKAIRDAGSAEPPKIREAMAATHFSGVTGNLSFDEDRNPIKTGVVIELKNGVQVFKEAIEP